MRRLIPSLNQLQIRLRSWVRWGVPVATVIVLGMALRKHGQEALAVSISPLGWIYWIGSLAITLLAHICSGWAWGSILNLFQHYPPSGWSLRVYLTTNLGKYLPGNIWHFYGRIQAATQLGIPLGIAVLSVGLEPVLMLAAALLLILLSPRADLWGVQILGLLVILSSIHPRILNRLIPLLTRKARQLPPEAARQITVSMRVERYPLFPFLAEILFISLRGLGFCLALSITLSWSWQQLPLLLSSFSLSWILGLIVPGAPGGLGVFESAIVLLLGSTFSAGALLNSVALYRISSLLAEALGAGLAWFIPLRIPRETL